MVKDFKAYYEESIRSYEYRLKFASIDVTEEVIDQIERLLLKYEIVEMSRPKKTIIQENPLDFYGLNNVDVTIIDIVTHIPFSPFNMQMELKSLLNVPEKFIVIRSENDPLEKETQRLNDITAMNDQAEKDGLTTASLLSIDPSSIENAASIPGKRLFGNEYNVSLLKFLAGVAANRVANTIKPESTQNPEPLKVAGTNNIGFCEPAENFNNDIIDAIKPVPYWEKSDMDIDMNLSKKLGPYDNLTDKISSNGKIYKDDNGKRIYVNK